MNVPKTHVIRYDAKRLEVAYSFALHDSDHLNVSSVNRSPGDLKHMSLLTSLLGHFLLQLEIKHRNYLALWAVLFITTPATHYDQWPAAWFTPIYGFIEYFKRMPTLTGESQLTFRIQIIISVSPCTWHLNISFSKCSSLKNISGYFSEKELLLNIYDYSQRNEHIIWIVNLFPKSRRISYV